MDLWHILNHLGEERDSYKGAVSPPIFQTSNFCFPSVDAFRKALTSELDDHFYTFHIMYYHITS
jgi:cystathionine beta-lyase/cystathionine gamma-synthase